jgi:hypothetical protein
VRSAADTDHPSQPFQAPNRARPRDRPDHNAGFWVKGQGQQQRRHGSRSLDWSCSVPSQLRYVDGHKSAQAVNNCARVNTVLDIPPLALCGLIAIEWLVKDLGDPGLGNGSSGRSMRTAARWGTGRNQRFAVFCDHMLYPASLSETAFTQPGPETSMNISFSHPIKHPKFIFHDTPPSSPENPKSWMSVSTYHFVVCCMNQYDIKALLIPLTDGPTCFHFSRCSTQSGTPRNSAGSFLSIRAPRGLGVHGMGSSISADAPVLPPWAEVAIGRLSCPAVCH